MKRVYIFIAMAVLLCAPVSAAPLSNEAKAALLLQRVASIFGQGNIEVAIGKLTQGTPAIPMPADELLGSVHMNMKTGEASGEMTTLYYEHHVGGFVAPSDDSGMGETLLPDLAAPGGTRMEVAQAGNTMGRSGAHIWGASSPRGNA